VPTKRQLLTVAALANALERESRAATPEPPGAGSGPFLMPVSPSTPTLDQLNKLVYDVHLVVDFEWHLWADEARRLMDRPAQLASADLVTLQKLLTCHFRQDRYAEGHLFAISRSGHLVAILRRLEQIARAMP
jgi:hypothetical protein